MSKPLPDDLPEEQKLVVLKRPNEILCCVKEKINEKLDPNKPDYDPRTSAKDVLAMCQVSKDEYNWALSVSADSDSELHLKFSFKVQSRNVSCNHDGRVRNTPKYLRSCCLPIGQNNTKDFSAQSGASIRRAV